MSKLMSTPGVKQLPTGPIRFKLTNDYMFRAVFQKNQKILKSLIAALLHMQAETILTVEILNPIVLGENIDNKTIVLDLLVHLNNNTYLNIEMQVNSQEYWISRSLYYLCKSFSDQLERGHGYNDLQPVILISICNFSPSELPDEFYGSYLLTNKRNFAIYSSQIQIKMLNLTQMDKAQPEDAEILKWAKLFKASTWEELRALADENDTFMEVCDTMYALSQDERIKWECLGREMYEHDQATIRAVKEKLNTAIANQNALISQQSNKIAEQDATISQQDATISRQDATISQQDATISRQGATISRQDATISQQDATIINAINGFHKLGLSDEEICQYLQLEKLPQ
ncbi:MAG: Rpn family recombination-promoting nuclease/putative transposase [Lachnospiraceae bacterium]|nr:Rpn family recombination-promoting nuclease/putative transposase [Lachnospiraceae bacterium]